MCNSLKVDIKKKAHLIRGLVNVLKDDIGYICLDAEANDLFIIEDSIHEAKLTIQRTIDVIEELECLVYLTKQDGTRKLHTPL